MFKIEINKDFLHTHIPNSFIDTHMQSVEPVFSLIYIYLLRYFDEPDKTEPALMAKLFDISEKKCVKALKHWEAAGLIKLDDTAPAAVKKTAAASPAPIPLPVYEVKKAEQKPSPPIYETERPVYSPEELEAYKKQEIIADLFSFAEEKFSRMLRYNDLNMLFSLYDWLRLDVSVIKKLIEYCADNGHTNINYIESVALDWAQRGIKTPGEADEYTQTFTNTYRDILKALGLTGRNPAPKQVELIEKWLREYNMPLEIILEACDKTVISASKPSFTYLSSILERWNKAGIKTVDDIARYEEAHIRQPVTPKAPRKRSRFANFEGRRIDYVEIEKLEDEYIDSLVKGK